MSKTALFLSLSIAALFMAGPASAEHRDEIFQVSTINALLEGVLEGDMDCASLARKGDFGIGTFNDLDGEMIALDGHFYQIKADGHVYAVGRSMKTPFAAVKYFSADRNFKIRGCSWGSGFRNTWGG